MVLFITLSINAQTNTGKINGLKDADGYKYDYIGEIKDNVPHGIGVAIYPEESNVLKYAGNFVQGNFEGKGVLLFKDKSFWSGIWEKGKLNGQVAESSKQYELFKVGANENHKQNGRTICIFNDGRVLDVNLKNDKKVGRGIYIHKGWDIVNDNLYENDLKNGQGFQCNLNNKQLYEGIWKDEVWLNESTNNYPSFLKDTALIAAMSDEYNLLVGHDDPKDLLSVTGIYYDKIKKIKQYGVFKDRKLTQGVTVFENKSKAIGQFNDEQLNGYGYQIKKEEIYNTDSYYEGEFSNGNLVGNKNIVINLGINYVGFGSFENNDDLIGQGWQSRTYNDLLIGAFELGRLNGKGVKITSLGYCINGIWSSDDLTELISLTNNKGELINTSPNTLQEAITILRNTYIADSTLRNLSDNLYEEKDKFYWAGDAYIGLLKLPQSEGLNYLAAEEFYTAVYSTTSNFDAANTKYAQLCDEINGLSIKGNSNSSALVFKGEKLEAKAKNEYTISTFTTSTNKKDYNAFYVSVLLLKDNETNIYKVALICGPKFIAEVLEDDGY